MIDMGTLVPPPTAPSEDALLSSILRRVRELVDGRLAAIIDRLPPEPPGKFRPPLGEGRIRELPLRRGGIQNPGGGKEARQ